jgi:hypothetical protein
LPYHLATPANNEPPKKYNMHLLFLQDVTSSCPS